MKNKIIIFTTILSTIGPAILATTHLSIYITLPSFLLALIISYLTYLLVNYKGDYTGLYGYSKDFHPLVGYIFLISWLVSYYLYTIYTAIYIPYYLLNLDGNIATMLSIIIETVIVISLLTNFYYIFPIIIFSQLFFILPFNIKLQSGNLVNIHSLFYNILSSSLILVCITLSTFFKFEKEYSKYVLYSAIIGGILLIYGSFFILSKFSIYGEAIGNFGLIMVEFLAIKDLFKGLNKEKIIKYLALLSIPIVAIGNINYNIFYNSLIAPSVTLLYLSLFLGFLSIFRYFKSYKIWILNIIALSLFIFGLYNAIISSRGHLFYESISALILSILIGSIVYVKKYNIIKNTY
ncbi:uncharacterized integral membrane protein SSO2702 [Nanoarchaeota archaeon]